MSEFHRTDGFKHEQRAASASTASQHRGVRGNSPRLTPNRIFATHLGSIIKQEKEVQDRAAKSSKTSQCKVIDEEGGGCDPAFLDVLPERQEPYGAESEDISSFHGVKEEIRIHLTTEVHLIPLPDGESPTQILDSVKAEEDDSIEDQREVLSPEPVPLGSHKTNAMEDLEATALRHRRSKSSKKHKKNLEASPRKGTKSPTRGVRKHLRKSSRRSKRSGQSKGAESPDLNLSPHKFQPKTSDEIEIPASNESRDEEDDKNLSLSASVKQESGSSSTPRILRDSSKCKRRSRIRQEEVQRMSSERDTSPMCVSTLSSLSKPIKTRNLRDTLYRENLNPLSKMSSSENFVDVAVSSASDDEIIDHEISTVRHCQRETESPSGISSRSGSGSSMPSTALDFIPFCAPRHSYQTMRQEMYDSPPMTGSPYASNWNLYAPSPTQYFPGHPPPAMQQGVFQWQSPQESEAIASLVRYPPPPHPLRAFMSVTPPPPPPRSAEYPIKRSSLPSEEYRSQPSNRFSLPPHLLIPGAEFSQQPPAAAPVPVVDRRFSCLQNLHNPPKPSIFGYQLIGDSLLLRFATQILSESAILMESLRFIGYCVSGQRIGDLLKRLKSGFYHVGNKVVLMIGTNDLVKNAQADQMIHELRRVLEHLCTKAEKIVVLTLPPVPLHEKFTHHWTRLNKYNDFIRTLNNKDMGISVFDISPLYLLSKEELEEEELLAEFNTDSPFCRGCLTCEEEVEEFSDSSWSDEDDTIETDLLSSVLVTTSSPISHLDICRLYCSKRIPKCRMDCFEAKYEASNRIDLVHLNRKGLELVKEELYKLI